MNLNPSPRQTLVEKARENWLRRLIDLSRRNNLLYFRDLTTGTLDLTDVDPNELHDLFAGKPVHLSQLVALEERSRGQVAAREIWRRAQANREEKGLQTLFVAVGMATWDPSDGGRPPEAAVILLPVALEFKGLSGQITLRRAGEPAANLVLLHVLEVEHGVRLEGDALLQVDSESESDDHLDPQPMFDRLQNACGGVRGFAINRRVILGNFSFQKMAMVKDLRDHAAAMEAHDLIAAIAGDAGAAQTLQNTKSEIDLKELDDLPPESEFLVLDADSSQQRVAAMVQQGQSLVIQGPPGTGKSQTIANLIASLAAQGKRVLFVAEKRAALEVVHQRLQRVRLGHLALDLHGADLTRREVMQRIAQNLALVREARPTESGDVHRRFIDRRRRLMAHVRRMHAKREPGGLSVFELQGELLRLPREAQTTVRWREPVLAKLTGETAQQVEDLLAEAAGFAALFLQEDPSPWNRAAVTDRASAEQAIDLTLRAYGDVPIVIGAVESLANELGLRAPVDFKSATELISGLSEITTLTAKYSPALFELDLGVAAGALAPAVSGLSTFWARLTNGEFRRALRTLRGLNPEVSTLSPAVVKADAERALELANMWERCRHGEFGPHPVPDSTEQLQRVQSTLSTLQQLSGLLCQCDLTSMAPDQLIEHLRALASDLNTVSYLVPLYQTERQLASLGCEELVAELRRRRPPTEQWGPLFRHAWLSSSLDQVRLKEPELAAFHGRTHNDAVAEFRHLDTRRIQMAALNVRRKHAEHAIAAMNQFPEQEMIVRREAEKKLRHMPLRRLLASAPDVLTALFPCFMASPLSVSQLMDAGRRYFDVVVFDEASQILPEDAVPSLLRGTQVAVAGDEHQLPPTIFFADGSDGNEEAEGEAAATAGFESLLNLTAALLPQRMLQWHYRSQDESLIAFSNQHIYGDELVTFPGRGGLQSLQHVLVEGGGGDGQEESSAAEVDRVIALVLEHAERRPGESLGVIAMGMKHAMRLQSALDDALRHHSELESFFDHQSPERFFIKNLERVQGDERDAIILSIGYSKDRSGRLPYRFGPLLQEGGHRRLNVAITRARKRMTVVSSFTHRDMDPARSSKRGVELLRLFLQFAAGHAGSGVKIEPQPSTLGDFEADLFEALQREGIQAIPCWGVSAYRIDLAALHPTRPGRFVLAIECDGATYCNAPTTRDRDRLRQQQLEGLGWRFHRIWSTDWFLRRQEELERLLAAYHDAVAAADRLDADGEARVASAVATERDADAQGQAEAEPVAGSRSRRPNIPVRSNIQEYSDSELNALVRWIASDGRLRTADEIVHEMVEELGFARRGKRIEERLREILKRI